MLLPLSCLLMGASLACSVGTGQGRAEGIVNAPMCEFSDAPYSLQPSFFGGELVVDDQLEVRMQRTGALEGASDGIRLLIRDPALIKRNLLGTPIDLATLDPFDPLLRMSFYLNESCSIEIDRVPLNYETVSGTVTFSAIYAPEVDDQDFRIALTFQDVRFEEPRRGETFYAVLDGDLDFLFNRGRPAQRYP